jgi:hypothetical protein
VIPTHGRRRYWQSTIDDVIGSPETSYLTREASITDHLIAETPLDTCFPSSSVYPLFMNESSPSLRRSTSSFPTKPRLNALVGEPNPRPGNVYLASTLHQTHHCSVILVFSTGRVVDANRRFEESPNTNSSRGRVSMLGESRVVVSHDDHLRGEANSRLDSAVKRSFVFVNSIYNH